MTSICKDRLYNISDAADIIGVTVKTLQRYCRQGHIMAVKVGPKLWAISGVTLARLVHDSADLQADTGQCIDEQAS